MADIAGKENELTAEIMIKMEENERALRPQSLDKSNVLTSTILPHTHNPPSITKGEINWLNLYPYKSLPDDSVS